MFCFWIPFCLSEVLVEILEFDEYRLESTGEVNPVDSYLSGPDFELSLLFGGLVDTDIGETGDRSATSIRCSSVGLNGQGALVLLPFRWTTVGSILSRGQALLTFFGEGGVGFTTPSTSIGYLGGEGKGVGRVSMYDSLEAIVPFQYTAL